MKYSSYLMQHQKDGAILAEKKARWLYAYDTGTGKTALSIEIIKQKRLKTLVICPLSIIEAAWMNDLSKFAPELRALNLWKALKSSRFTWEMLAKYDIVIINYESFKSKKVELQRCDFKIVMLDESSKLKESRTLITKAVTSFCQNINYVYLFSGTPAPNSMMEYFSQIKIINPNILGFSFFKFRATYFFNYGYGGFQWKINPEREQFLMDSIALCSSVVRKEDVLDLPERTNNIRTVYLSAEEKKAYEKMKNDMLLQIEQGEISAANAAVKVMKLRQITSGFLMGEIDQVKQVHPLGTSKEVALMELLEEIGSHQAIIWTQFHEEARRLTKLLGSKAAVINGSVKQEDRDISIVKFKNNELQYLIAHPRSLGHGVTLTNCSYAIYYSLDYSHEAHSQSRDRIYRYGQKNACTYYYLLADKTVDGVILKALDNKSSVERAVFDYIRESKKKSSDRFVTAGDKVVTEMTNFNDFIGDFEEQGIEL